MYYTMEQEFHEEPTYVVGIRPNITPKPPWYKADRFEVAPEQPIELLMDPKSGPVMPDFFSGPIPIFSWKLYHSFLEAGVNNLDAYDTIMIDPGTGQRWSNYYAVNVVGKVKCVAMDSSSYKDPTGSGIITVFFDELAINEKLTGDALCFRLAESLGELVVHEKVVRHVQNKKCRLIRFLELGSV